MSKEKEAREKYPSTFTIDNFSSTTQLANNEVKIPVGSKLSLSEKEYDPFEHRKVDHPNSYGGALIHLVKSSLGTGVLAIPSAFKSVGLVIGLIGTLLVGVLCTHTIHLLVAGSQEICRRTKTPQLGFAETAEAIFKHGPSGVRAWSTFARYFVDVALISTYNVGNAVYVVFIASQVKEVIDYNYPDYSNISSTYYMLVIMVLLMIFCQVRELRYLVPFSFIANVTLILAFSITLYYVFRDVEQLDFKDTPLVKNIDGVPLFFSTVLFAMEGIGTILPVENSLSKPKQFLAYAGILNVGMSIIVFFFTIIGFFGYLRYGDSVDATITKNIPASEIVAQVAKISISLSVFFTFMLQFYVPMDITWRKLVSGRVPTKYHNHAQVLLRIAMVFVITAIAVAVPDLGTIIDLVGSVFFSTLGLFIPAVMDTVLRWENGLGVCYWKLMKNVGIILLAIFALCSGVFYAVQHLING